MAGGIYYNEWDDNAAATLAELMKDGLIPHGEIDRRSITEVQIEDIVGYEQCHFFAGIGGWPEALRLARWPAGHRVWTGSCPCQPFSAAGKRMSTDDVRHLWPEFRRLIADSGITDIFGEQVASADGRVWLSDVRLDLEAMGYAVGAADLCAAGIGAPHIRQRLFWVADAECDTGNAGRITDQHAEGDGTPPAGARPELGRCGLPSGLGITNSAGRQQGKSPATPARQGHSAIPAGSVAGGLGDADNAGSQGRDIERERGGNQRSAWSPGVAIQCADGKTRIVPASEEGEPEPGLFPLAYGFPNRVGALRCAGNAIVPQVAAEFIKAYMQVKRIT